MRVQVRVQKKYFFEFKFEFGKMIEFFQVRNSGNKNIVVFGGLFRFCCDLFQRYQATSTFYDVTLYKKFYELNFAVNFKVLSKVNAFT